VYLCRRYGLQEVADYWESVVRINEYQKQRFVLTILNAMFNTLAGKKICLFGFAFKADTGDTRESPAIFIAKKLAEEKAQIVITDPQALENARVDLQELNGRLSFKEDPYKAALGCDAIAVVTEWDLYKDLDYDKIYQSMRKPAFMFDGRNILDHQSLFEIGYNVYPIGKPKLTHFTKNK
jgi:UDPglucose 6-dehydrogenase